MVPLRISHQLKNIQITPEGIDGLSDSRMGERVDQLVKGIIKTGRAAVLTVFLKATASPCFPPYQQMCPERAGHGKAPWMDQRPHDGMGWKVWL